MQAALASVRFRGRWCFCRCIESLEIRGTSHATIIPVGAGHMLGPHATRVGGHDRMRTACRYQRTCATRLPLLRRCEVAAHLLIPWHQEQSQQLKGLKPGCASVFLGGSVLRIPQHVHLFCMILDGFVLAATSGPPSFMQILHYFCFAGAGRHP